MTATDIMRGMNVHIKDVPEDILDKFRIWCSYHGKTMKAAIIELMQEKGNEIEIVEKKK